MRADRATAGQQRFGRAPHSLARWTGVLVAVAAVLFGSTGISWAQDPPCSPSLAERQRYGFVATLPNWAQSFEVDQLRAGWYVALGSPSSPPEGWDRAVVLRIEAGYTVQPAQIGPVVDGSPGTLWLIGNEPDCIWQDNVLPEEYARIYHDLYAFIKSRDWTSRVSPGGIVQPTPLRLEYLDRVLAAYQAQYGGPMPVDVWNIHNAILNEQQGSWGADIPPGIDATEGVVRDISDNDNMEFFIGQIWAFRQWMADRGYGGYPLVITEYGILMPAEYEFDVDRVNAFMSATFAFLEDTTDPALGDPDDGDRLVQRWAWFSLDVPPWDPISGEGFNGNLFDPDTGTITAFGQNYASHTGSFPPLAYVDLAPSAFRVLPSGELAGPSQTVTRSLEVRVANVGTVDSGSFDVALAYDGPLSGTLEAAVDSLAAGSGQWIPFTLAGLEAGSYSIAVDIDPGNEVTESLECNNGFTATVLAPTDRLYVPQVSKSWEQAAVQTRSTSLSSPQPPSVSSPMAISGFQQFGVPTANSYPAQIVLDGQGRVWISERDGNKIASFDPQTEVWQEYDILTAGSQPWGLTLDAAGNVWFAETAANQIGKLEVATGGITEYLVPSPLGNSQPWDVAVGSDGAVWFTERADNQIGKLMPGTGSFAEYDLSTTDGQPTGIHAGGSYIYFVEVAGDQFGRLQSTTGQLIEKPRPAGSQPQEIALAGADSVWFTETGANRIVLFQPTTTGLFHPIDLNTPDSEPYGIAMEGNVAVWFTERAGNNLGRFTGSIPPREYALPTPGSLPTGIVVDGAGCAWYTAPGANRIGRLCLTSHYVYLPLALKSFP